jgi:hypothetical protein
VNAVRLYVAMRNVHLPELATAGGEGKKLLRKTLQAIARAHRRHTRAKRKLAD